MKITSHVTCPSIDLSLPRILSGLSQHIFRSADNTAHRFSPPAAACGAMTEIDEKMRLITAEFALPPHIITDEDAMTIRLMTTSDTQKCISCAWQQPVTGYIQQTDPADSDGFSDTFHADIGRLKYTFTSGDTLTPLTSGRELTALAGHDAALLSHIAHQGHLAEGTTAVYLLAGNIPDYLPVQQQSGGSISIGKTGDSTYTLRSAVAFELKHTGNETRRSDVVLMVNRETALRRDGAELTIGEDTLHITIRRFFSVADELQGVQLAVKIR